MQSKFEIRETEDTPYVILDSENQKFEISGNSMRENIIDFYEPIIKWLTEYLKNQPESFEINFKLKYFNSSTTKELFLLFLKISEVSQNNCNVNWYVEDDDELIEELGYEIQEVIDIPIKVIHYDEN